MGVRAGFLAPTYASGFWTHEQELHWRVVLHIDENKVECGAVLPAKLSAGNVANIGMGLLNPAFQRAIINNSGLAHWFPVDPEANWTILGTRRSAIASVYTIYLGGFHMLHYPGENLQRCLADFQIEQREDTNAPFNVHGRRQAWDLFYAIFGKHLQGSATIKEGGGTLRNPHSYDDEDGEMSPIRTLHAQHVL